MKYIASCSFGKDSLATILLARIHKEPLDLVLYCEVMFDKKTSGEMPEHRDFIYNTAINAVEKMGYPVKIVRSEMTYKDNFYHIVKKSKVPERNGKFRGFPIAGKCAINRDCKINPIKKFYKTEKIKECIQYIGIAADEHKRLERLNGTNKISLLNKYGYTEAMAYELCREYDLLSPIYDFTNRGGCFFCPNCKDTEFKHLKRYHLNLWKEMLGLEQVENKVSRLFNREEKLMEIDNRISQNSGYIISKERKR